MRRHILVSCFILAIFFEAGALRAEDAAVNAVIDIDEELEYTYGSVISVSPEAVIINEYNYETDEEVQVAYTLTPETKFGNVASAQELVKDNNVDIYYKVINDQKVATMITRDDTVYQSSIEQADIGSIEEETVTENLPDNTVAPPVSFEIEMGPMTIGNETRG